jgi:hypothetical protein
MFNTRMKVKPGKKVNEPFALRYNLRVLSFTFSSQRDSTPSTPPSPWTRSSLLMSIGPSLSRSAIPRRLRRRRIHIRKRSRRKRNVERTIKSGRRTRRASLAGSRRRGSPLSWLEGIIARTAARVEAGLWIKVCVEGREKCMMEAESE